MKFLLFILSAGTIYRFGEDSSIQPGHIITPLVTVTLFFVALCRGVVFKLNAVHVILLSCVIYFFFRNIFEIIFLNRIEILTGAFYWINFLMLFIILINMIKALDWIYFAKCLMLNVFLSSIVAVFQIVKNFPMRAYGLSGTENHLALQIVHVSLILFLIYHRSNWTVIFLRVIGFSTLSRAYMVHVALLFFAKKTLLRLAIVVFIIIFVLLMTNVVDFQESIPSSESFDFLINRLSFMGNGSDQDGRGYLRLINNPQYFFYGASEVVKKFDGDPFYGQIHSNFVSLIFCFGVPGAVFSIFYLRQLYLRLGFFVGLSYVVYSLTGYFYSNQIFLIFSVFLFRHQVKNTFLSGLR